MLDPFEQRRQQVLEALNSQEIDKSRAGGVDARISDLVNGMNKHAHLYTTSSCSGIHQDNGRLWSHNSGHLVRWFTALHPLLGVC